MFWIVLLFSGLGMMFFKLGAMSVTVELLSLGLRVAMLAIFCAVLLLLWRKIFGNKNNQKQLPDR